MDSSGEQEYSQIIESSLAAILSGESTLDVILARYPERSQEIRAEVEAALWLSARRSEVGPRAGFVPASRKRLVARIQAESLASSRSSKRASLGLILPRRFGLQFASALVIFMMLFISTFGAVSASQGAVPGDNLYAIKRMSEDVQYTLTVAPAQRAQLSLEYSSRRLDEVEVLITRGRYEDVAETLNDFEYKVNQSVALLKELEDANGSESTDGLAESIQMQLDRQTEHLNYLLAIAPSTEFTGLERAAQVSTSGSKSAGEMKIKEQPRTPTQTSTPTLAKTETPGRENKQPSKTVSTPVDKENPKLGEATKTPRPTIEKKPTNTDKPQQETKPEKPTKEENTNNGSNPPELPPGQDKPPKEDSSNNSSDPPDTPPGQDKEDKEDKEKKP